MSYSMQKTSWIVQIDVPLTDITDEIQSELLDIFGIGASAQSEVSDELSSLSVQNWYDDRLEAEAISEEAEEYVVNLGLNFDISFDRIDYA